MRLSMELFGKYQFDAPTRKVSSQILKQWYNNTKEKVKGFEDKQLLHLIDVIPGMLILLFRYKTPNFSFLYGLSDSHE